MTRKDEGFIKLHPIFYGAQAKFLKELQRQCINMTAFVRKAVAHYMPTYIENLEILKRYEKAVKDQLRYSGEDV